MDIDIQISFAVHRKMKNRKRIAMLHRKIFVGIFNRFRDNIALHIAPIDKIVLIIAISSGDYRFSNKSLYMKPRNFFLRLKQVC